MSQLVVFSAEKLSDGSPRYVFRGQAKQWYTDGAKPRQTITPSIARLKSAEARQQAHDVCRHAKLLGMGLFGYAISARQEAVGLLQHYLWPTPALDVTDDPDVAMAFAHDGNRAGENAVMLVLDRARLPAQIQLAELWFTPLPLASGGINTRFLHQSGWILLPSDWASSACFGFDLLDPFQPSAIVAHYEFVLPADYLPNLTGLMNIENDPLPWRVQDVVRLYLDHLRMQGVTIDPIIEQRVDAIAGPQPLPRGLSLSDLAEVAWQLPRWHALGVAHQLIKIATEALRVPGVSYNEVVKPTLDYVRDVCAQGKAQPAGRDFGYIQSVTAASEACARNATTASERLLCEASSALISTAQVYEWNIAADAGLTFAIRGAAEALDAGETSGLITNTEAANARIAVFDQFEAIHANAQAVHRETVSVGLP